MREGRDISKILSVLQKLDIFTALPAAELANLAAELREFHAKTETTLCREGEEGGEMYILMEGELQIVKKDRRISKVTAVDYIGEMSLLENEPRSATVIAAAGSRLLTISARQFKHYFADEPRVMAAMLKTLSRRLRQDNELIAAEFTQANILIHDMRNNMAAFTLLHLLERNCRDKKQLHYIQLMRKSSQDLAAMMSEALANAKRLRPRKEVSRHSLSTIITELSAGTFKVHPDIRDKIVELDLTDIDSDNIKCQATDIRRVITNLVINAAQASKTGGRIRIGLQCRKNQAVVSISDEGHGIPIPLRSKIFFPNFSTRAEGNGLGLTSCRQIIEEEHGGSLTFTTSDKGTRFTFTLPRQ
ncbi:MAG TPA: cyclic nucleotide-binding domain-containing protein [Desulfobacterales bacterium]|nr:cyclic nucleotide-binding domain-containing protein [Desulfobacterales bacterium]